MFFSVALEQNLILYLYIVYNFTGAENLGIVR